MKSLTSHLDDEIMDFGGQHGYDKDEIATIEREAIKAYEGETPAENAEIEKELSDFFAQKSRATPVIPLGAVNPPIFTP